MKLIQFKKRITKTNSAMKNSELRILEADADTAKRMWDSMNNPSKEKIAREKREKEIYRKLRG
ncbi:MAG: hypothetical protein ACRC5C_10135 [Bacilli bacterium]